MSKTIKDAAWIWKNGDFVPWAEATLHVLSTAVQFGSSVFEGIRCYDTAQGPAIFRLPEHLRRLRNSCPSICAGSGTPAASTAWNPATARPS